jgi:hypothetical protein
VSFEQWDVSPGEEFNIRKHTCIASLFPFERAEKLSTNHRKIG